MFPHPDYGHRFIEIILNFSSMLYLLPRRDEEGKPVLQEPRNPEGILLVPSGQHDKDHEGIPRDSGHREESAGQGRVYAESRHG